LAPRGAEAVAGALQATLQDRGNNDPLEEVP
jgi:hypothetical protein